jgi:hypothetical protein
MLRAGLVDGDRQLLPATLDDAALTGPELGGDLHHGPTDEDVPMGSLDDLLRDRAEEEPLRSLQSAIADDDELGVDVFGGREDLLRGVALEQADLGFDPSAVDIDRVSHHQLAGLRVSDEHERHAGEHLTGQVEPLARRPIRGRAAIARDHDPTVRCVRIPRPRRHDQQVARRVVREPPRQIGERLILAAGDHDQPGILRFGDGHQDVAGATGDRLRLEPSPPHPGGLGTVERFGEPLLGADRGRTVPARGDQFRRRRSRDRRRDLAGARRRR